MWPVYGSCRSTAHLHIEKNIQVLFWHLEINLKSNKFSEINLKPGQQIETSNKKTHVFLLIWKDSQGPIFYQFFGSQRKIETFGVLGGQGHQKSLVKGSTSWTTNYHLTIRNLILPFTMVNVSQLWANSSQICGYRWTLTFQFLFGLKIWSNKLYHWTETHETNMWCSCFGNTLLPSKAGCQGITKQDAG